MPIITVPIVSKALGPQGLGTYGYVNSITTYFVMVAGLGLSVYGAREIARKRDNRQQLSHAFWEIQLFNMMICSIVLVVFLIVTHFFQYANFYQIQVLVIIGTFLDISWYYQGIEDFKKISLANITVKVLTLLLIINLVKNKNDLGNYFFIQSSSTLISQTILWLFVLKKISFVRISFKEVFSHLKPALTYFIGKIYVQLYTTMNTTLLGTLGSTVLVAYYINSRQIATIIITLIGVLDSVLVPRLTNMFEKGDEKQMLSIMKKSLHLNFFLTIPGMFGIIATNVKLVDWFFGDKFENIKVFVPLLAPLVVLIPLGTAMNRQYLIPRGRVKDLNRSLMIGGIVGLSLNLLLIPKLGIYGGIIATLAAEGFVAFYRVYKLYKETNFRYNYLLIAKILIASVMMLCIVEIVTRNMFSSPLTTLLQVIIGILSYTIMITLLGGNIVLTWIKEARAKMGKNKLLKK
jgi:O-antigen/teichoic acid export membrane protein